MNEDNDREQRMDERRADLALLDAEIAAQDTEAARRGIERAGQLQLALLRVRLLGVLDIDPDDFGDEAVGNWWTDHNGQIVAWFVIDGIAYYVVKGVIHAEREARGRLEWTVLDPDGTPVEPWQTTDPPGGRWMLN